MSQGPKIKELPAVQLSKTSTERQNTDNLADLFAIVVALDRLEAAYVKDSVPVDSYQKSCQKLLAQYKTQKEVVGVLVPDLESFMKDYSMNCRAAANRIAQGVPATIMHGGGKDENKGKELSVFHAVQHFITTMDALKLAMKAVDQLHPNLSDLMDSLNKVADLPPDHESRTKVKEWLVKLNSMKAHDELSDDDLRQMSFDLDTSYAAFHRFIQGAK